MKAFSVIVAAVATLAACTQGEVMPASGSDRLAESCLNAGYETDTAEFRKCQETLANAALIRSRVRELRGTRR